MLDLASFLSASDRARAAATLARLDRHGFDRLVLTGGFAVEAHCARGGLPPQRRHFIDIDFLVNTFSEIPITLQSEFLFHHVHPHDPPAKTLLQAVDPETQVRVDVFRAYGKEMERAVGLSLEGARRVVGLEDLVARTARLSLDLSEGEARAAEACPRLPAPPPPGQRPQPQRDLAGTPQAGTSGDL